MTLLTPGYFESLYRAAEGESADIAVAPFVITDEDLNVESPCIWAFSRNDAILVIASHSLGG